MKKLLIILLICSSCSARINPTSNDKRKKHIDKNEITIVVVSYFVGYHLGLAIFK